MGDKGYDSDKIREMLAKQDISPYIPPRHCKTPVHDNKGLYRMGHKIENIFPQLKDWRPIAIRYHHCAQVFRSAILLATPVLFW